MIYRDAFGRPSARATISLFGCPPFSPRHYSLTCASDCPSRSWDVETPPEDIIAEMEAGGWSCSVRKNGYGEPVIDLTHIETQALIDEERSAQAASFDGAERGFVRFGNLPEGGRSRNHRDDRLEAGVSCFDAEFSPSGAYRLLLTPVLEVSFFSVSDRPAFRLYGERVGTGADGEPLLRVDRAVSL